MKEADRKRLCQLAGIEYVPPITRVGIKILKPIIEKYDYASHIARANYLWFRFKVTNFFWPDSTKSRNAFSRHSRHCFYGTPKRKL